MNDARPALPPVIRRTGPPGGTGSARWSRSRTPHRTRRSRRSFPDDSAGGDLPDNALEEATGMHPEGTWRG